MNERTFRTLEFDKILSQMRGHAVSDKTRQAVTPALVSNDMDEVRTMIEEVDDASTILRYRNVEMAGITDIKEHVGRALIGSMLSIGDFNEIKNMLFRKHSLYNLFEEFESDEVEVGRISHFIMNLPDIHHLYKKISATVDETGVLDHASENLLRIRRRINAEEGKIREKLNDLIRGNQQRKLSDGIITMRNNRYVVPVKIEHRSDFNGIVHDMSQSGQTVYMEPMAVVQMTNRIQSLRDEEALEIERILYDLSARTAEVSEELSMTDDNLHHLDMVFAKAKYGMSIGGTKPEISDTRRIYLPAAFHPLIDSAEVVKNDIMVDEDTQAVIITGPNTGGKTVTLKTVGLSQLMAQAGIPVPARDGSVLPVFKKVYSDIGDEQSIEQSLSTFSSHLTNTKVIIDNADDETLVLLDEVGAGTDPEEGAALAIGIIENLLAKRSTLIATTHYPQIKSFSYTRDDVVNASVEFDVNTLSPTYRLLMGIPGRSNAFEISNKLGLDPSIIERAKELVKSDSKDVNDMITALESHTTNARGYEEETERLLQEARQLQGELKEQYDQYQEHKEKLFKEARHEANRVIRQSEVKAEGIIEELNSMKADGAKNLEEHEIIEKRKGLRDSYHQESLKQQVENEKTESFEAGDSVDVLSYGQKGEILSIEKDEAIVQMGILKMNIPLKELKKRKKEKVTRPVARRTGKSVVKSSLDLRGSRYEEAIMALDRYLDQVLLSSYSQVEIIHGKGTGALQKGVQEHLKQHPKVKSYRMGHPNEGGFGVTIVEMK
ncbi:endonuclease MutS2 [Lacicoccus alkaliphilus]|uniref:Endonuclease MutS2 n=1 Tax=Lacicoccus alkaliphilus DSM 16010 TaxID=1123231 RepID=A0A1M7AVK0_9BACL|nr:endonuclease MutS2 [Salinicoccus alkaliphilus]SHL46449.1 DNA mismatch repair protein MutS2 [Salinicoccus alkaliphilus DSM 16010]